MIELLIVIAVLGILAVAVLSAINPIEQINRSRDTGSRSDAEQLISAIDRFYASKGYYPWASSEYDNQAINWTNTKSSSFSQSLNVLSEEGTAEVKASFVNKILSNTYNPLFIYNQGRQGDSTYVCFTPKSSSFANEAMKRCAKGLPSDIDSSTCGLICTGDQTTVKSCLP